MSVAHSAAEVLDRHVVMELESIDRMYLNVYVPILQRPAGCAHFWRMHRGKPVPSSKLMQSMTRRFVRGIERFCENEKIPLIRFAKNERKEDVAAKHFATLERRLDRAGLCEGVAVVGKAQEKTKVVRTENRTDSKGVRYPWLVHRSAMINHYYFYCIDEDFGRFFLKFASYFPYNAKLCINGHEYVKRQLAKEGIAFEASDNSILWCEDPQRMQELADGLTADKIDGLLRKWFSKLPHPFTPEDREARYLYEVSILQSEFALTQVLDRPLSGRIFFEQLIRDNIDIGRPDWVQLIFNRRITKRTPSRFRTRVIVDGVVPSLHVDYKNSRIKQYHKEGRALRTETTINDTYDFDIGRLLKNLDRLREVGFQANRRLLSVQRISHDTTIGEDTFNQVHRPIEVDGQRASALRFADPRVLALLAAIVVFRLLPSGFTNRQLREKVAPLLGVPPEEYHSGKMTYDLRRLRLHGIIERIPHTRRYVVTDFGFRTALFATRAHARLLRAGYASIADESPPVTTRLKKAFDRVDREVDRIWTTQRAA